MLTMTTAKAGLADSGRNLDLVMFTSERLANRFGMPLKRSVILIRWPVVLICAYLLLSPAISVIPDFLLQFFVVVYVLSNAFLYGVAEDRFASPWFFSPLVLADTVVLTLSLVINGRAETDFYLTYFLLIIICCIFENPKVITTITVLSPLVYMLLLFRSTGTVDPGVFLRFPFLFVISLFFGSFTRLARAETTLKVETLQRTQGKKEALDIVSHELRAPLGLIGGYAEALKQRMFGDVSAAQEEALSKIIRHTDGLLTMVNSVLDLARIEAGDAAMRREEIPLGAFLEQMQGAYEAPLGKPVLLRWSIGEDLPTLYTDKMKLTIILQNLINNALKFTDEGTVEITARRNGEQVEFEVADSGVGIPPEALPVIFEKFRQAENGSATHRGGVGLGLHIVKVFTDLLGGTIAVKSAPPKGSTFTLSLPADFPRKPAPARAGAKDASSLSILA
jgi:signal transduction histidine kinase